MLVYFVKWFPDSHAHGKGRIPSDEKLIGCTVLCRDSKDAISCFEWYFANVYKNTRGYDITDGTISLTKIKLDSRKFDIQYLQMDGIKKPLCLHNVKDSLAQLTYNIY